MNLQIEPYLTQISSWPHSGKHIMAQYDEEMIVVYQAYHPTIATYALEHGCFGGEFKMNRMTWIKPNFLWMMYRSGWGQKKNQEMVLAIYLCREVFEQFLQQAVHTTYQSDQYPSYTAWQQAVKQSDVRLQWDPDHDPIGNAVLRRALQIGIKGKALEQYNNEAIIKIEDMTPFVQEQKTFATPPYTSLYLPKEEVYWLKNQALARQIGLDVLDNESAFLHNNKNE